MNFSHYAEPGEYETLTGTTLVVGYGSLDGRDDVIALGHEGVAFLTITQAQQVVNNLTECIEVARTTQAVTRD